MKKAYLLTVFAMPLVLSGCADWQRTLAAGGAALCGTVVSQVGGGGTGARVARGVGAGAVCGLIGGAIGHALDERDRERMALARAQALQQRLPPQYYQPGFRADTYQVAAGYGGAVPSSTAKRHLWSRPDGTPTDAPPTASVSSGRFPGLAPVQGASWVSDHSGASGSVTVVSAEKPKGGRGECRTLAQVVSQPGEALATEETKVCESRPGAADWAQL